MVQTRCNIDVTGIAGGQSDVQVRWHYYNAFWAWWWQVDDVVVGEAGCVPGPAASSSATSRASTPAPA